MIDETWYQRPAEIPERQAAGGVVVRREGGRWLVVLAREKGFSSWVLPKGGVDAGEPIEAAARREIAEEVGVRSLRLLEDLGVEERLSFSKVCWSVVHYFLYETWCADCTPDDTEHHDPAAWFGIDALPEMLWPEQRRLVERVRQRLKTRYR
jgi:ADP-ribose pyrophosphatase YjhB (NUDIX family)